MINSCVSKEEGMSKHVARKRVQLRKLTLGNGTLALIMPIAAKNKEEMLELADEFLPYNPDLLEWRIDFMENITDVPYILDALHDLRKKIADTPIMATIRHPEENGVQLIEDALKKRILLCLIESREVDMVDIEARYPEEYIKDIKKCCLTHHVALMVSYHDLEKTPDEETVFSILQKEVSLGADVCKVSFFANSYGDNGRLGLIIQKAKESDIEVPVISISAGPKGTLSRICGEKFGSDGTFVSTGRTHQIHIEEVRMLRRCLGLN